MKHSPVFYLIIGFLGGAILLFLIAPPFAVFFHVKPLHIFAALKREDVTGAILLSLYTATLSALVVVLFGTPLAYATARWNNRFTKLVSALIDIPLVLPHTVAGIAILTVFARRYAGGKLLHAFGLSATNSISAIVFAMIFVSAPYYIGALRNGIEKIPYKMELVSKNLGRGSFYTFFKIVLPLSANSAITGFLLTWARSISEFGAVIILAYYPMTAPVLIYEKFETQGLSAVLPITGILIIITLIFFVILKIFSEKNAEYF